MNYIIIGGGIGGLYTAYSLHKKKGIKNITVIERSNRLGGRINTLYLNEELTLEMGAGAIPNIHHRELKLLSEMGLYDKLSSGSSGRSYAEISTIPTNKYINEANLIPTIYHIDKFVPLEKTDFYDILGSLRNKLKNKNFYQIALNYSLYRLIEKYYGTDKADQLKYQFGYHDDFAKQNAVDALSMFNRSFAANTKFHKLNGGLIQLINKLVKYLEKNSINIMINTELVDITKNNSTYTCLLKNGQKIIADNIILAITKKDIIKINYLNAIRTKLDSVIGKALIRIYVFFPLINNKVWFDKIERVVTTKTILNQIVPINKEKGILMIYCDDENAKAWNILHKNNILETELMYHLTKLFSDINIPKPTKIIVSFYEVATHLWKPGVDSAIMYYEIMQPLKDEYIYIVGETYSLTQQWTEGVLESVDYLVDKLLVY